MKWFLTLLIFIAGVYYLVDQRKADMRRAEMSRAETSQKAAAEQAKQDVSKATGEAALPLKPDRVTVITFSKQTLKTLRELAFDPNEKVRAAAADLLWQLQDDQAPSIIKRMFQDETDETVKKALIDILVKDKSMLSLALLSEALNTYDKGTKLKAVDAIGTFSNREAILVLNKGLTDYDEDIRLKALEAVNNIRRDIVANKEQQLRAIKSLKPLFKTN